MKSVCTNKVDWLVLWCLTPRSTIFQLYRGGQFYYPLANEVAKGYSNATVRPSVTSL